MSMNVGPHRESGFTLLETLVSVMLLALAVAFLPGLLSLGTRSMQARTAMDAQSAEAPAQQFLEQRLAGAVAAVRRGDDGRLMPAFAGRRDELTFVAPAARSAALVGMLDYRLSFVSRGSVAGRPSGVLNVSTRPYAVAADSTPIDTTLMRNVASLSFRYFGRARGDDVPGWHDEWLGQSQLPLLVEMKSMMDGSNSVAEHVLVVALRLATPDEPTN